MMHMVLVSLALRGSCHLASHSFFATRSRLASPYMWKQAVSKCNEYE